MSQKTKSAAEYVAEIVQHENGIEDLKKKIRSCKDQLKFLGVDKDVAAEAVHAIHMKEGAWVKSPGARLAVNNASDTYTEPQERSAVVSCLSKWNPTEFFSNVEELVSEAEAVSSFHVEEEDGLI